MRFLKIALWGGLALIGAAGTAHAHFHIDAPMALSATGDSAKLTLSWAAPAAGVISGYRVRWALNRGSSAWINPNGAAGEDIGLALTHEISPLVDGKTYAVQVAAANGGGGGVWSGSVTAVAGAAIQLFFSFHDDQFFVPLNKIRPAPGVPVGQIEAGHYEYIAHFTEVILESTEFRFTGDPEVADITVHNAANTISHTFSGTMDGSVTLPLELGVNQYVIDMVTHAGKTQSYHVAVARANPPANKPVVTLAAGHQSLRISWSHVIEAGGFVETYGVQWALLDAQGNRSGSWRNANVAGPGISGEGGALEYTAGGLTNGSTYAAQVHAVNFNADGPYSDQQTAVPTAAEDAVLSQLVVTGSDAAAVTLLPAFHPDRSAYTANVANAVSSATLTAAARTSSAGFTLKIGAGAAAAGSGGTPSAPGAIPAGGRLDFVIIATAASGNTARTYTVTVNRAHDAPAGVIAESGARAGVVRIGWSAPASNSGAGIIAYRLRWRQSDTDADPLTVTPGSWQNARGGDNACNNADPADDAQCGEQIIGATEYRITGLSVGLQYDVAVVALNIAGLGMWSGDTAAQITPSDAMDATLSALLVTGSDASMLTLTKSGAQSSAGFDAEHETYTAEVAHTVASVTATPTTSISGATVTVDGAAVASGAASAPSPEIPAGGSRTVAIVVTATDAAASKTYSVEVRRDFLPLTFAAPPADVRFHGGAAHSVILPAAEGGRPSFSYALQGALPAGLAFTAAERLLSGAPESVSAVAEATMTYTATDSNTPPASVTRTFRINVAPPLEFATPAPGSLSFAFTTRARKTLPQASGGFAPFVYSLEGDALPAGLTFTAATRVLAGVPKETGAFRIVYTAADATMRDAGVVRARIELQIAALPPNAPRGLRASPADKRLRLSWNAPAGDEAGGEAPSGYRVRWAEGSGSESWVNPNAEMGEFAAAAKYTITGLVNGSVYPVQVAAVNSAGRGVWSDSVESAPEAGLAFSAQQGDVRVFFGGNNTLTLLAAENGKTPYTYALSGLPAGIVFNAAARSLTATPAGINAPPIALTYSVTDANGVTDSQEFRLHVDSLDVDRSGEVNVQDGIMVARYLLGVRGAALLDGQSDPENLAVVAQSMETGAKQIGGNPAAFDVARWAPSANVTFNPNGIFILRYLLGMRADALRLGLEEATAGADISAKFPGGVSVEQAIQALLP
ncbi:MAG: fibronectin type III domain-containing protein [Gammaproteobacteria bacterium]